MTIRHCSAPVAEARAGPRDNSDWTSVIAVGWRALTGRPRLGTGSQALSGRGLDNMKIQAYLTAAAINFKRLAAAPFCHPASHLDRPDRRPRLATGPSRPRCPESARGSRSRMIRHGPRAETGFFNRHTRHLCRVASRIRLTAASRPLWSSEIASCTALSPRRARERRNSVQRRPRPRTRRSPCRAPRAGPGR